MPSPKRSGSRASVVLAAIRWALQSAPRLVAGQLLVALATAVLPVFAAWLTKLGIES
ncbi:hypothetical protein [Kribbella sp. NPDC006257]|uniref:hypothetical protein n=1 Tax=Kribbella sp. NPDC006257 TaxID=3156738 RepID=UPI0033A35CA6